MNLITLVPPVLGICRKPDLSVYFAFNLMVSVAELGVTTFTPGKLIGGLDLSKPAGNS